MKIQIPAAAQEIVEKLCEHGYEAYLVGGCVRDMLLGREPGDWDITTSAKPEEVKAVFRRTVDTGIQHGTVTVMMGKEGYEVTTFRIDGDYTDGRHPDSVTFTPDLIEDLKRRDFTINAMAYNRDRGLVDAFGGRKDLEDGVICCVGAAEERFTEDALRILRAIRFSAQLGFEIEEHTENAIKKIAPNLVHVSRERVQVELTKLLISPLPGRIRQVYETGISPWVSETFHRIPEISGGSCFHIPSSVPAEKSLRWAVFMRKCEPKEAVLVLKALKLDNDTIYRVKTLVQWIKVSLCGEPTEDSIQSDKDDAAIQAGYLKKELSKHNDRIKTGLRRAMSRMEPELFDDLLRVKLCLAEECPPAAECLRALCSLRDEIRRDGDCISLKMLAVTGNDLIKAGMKPGKEVGTRLQQFLELVLEDPVRNTKEYLLSLLSSVSDA